MSSTIAPIYRAEDTTVNHPATAGAVTTHCNDGSQNVLKKFREIFIHWNAGTTQWVEDDVYNPLAVEPHVALRIDNQCTGEFSYVDIGYNDFRLLGLCCRTEGIFVPAFDIQFI